MTCWRRLWAWRAAGVWEALHRRILGRLNLAGEIDGSRASVDASAIPAKKGATRSAHRSRQTRFEAPHLGRSQRPAARPHPDWSQRPRQQGFDRHQRRASAAPASAGKATKTAAQTARRQGVRLCPLQPRTKDQRYHSPHRPAQSTQVNTLENIDGSSSEPSLGSINCRLIIHYERRADLYRAFLTLAAAIICWRNLKHQVLLAALSTENVMRSRLAIIKRSRGAHRAAIWRHFASIRFVMAFARASSAAQKARLTAAVRFLGGPRRGTRGALSAKGWI
jgi:hypothetical protein